MPIIKKGPEKFKVVIDSLNGDVSEERFIEKFKEIYPEDWKRIVITYQNEEKKTKPGKSHPMPEPKRYLLNFYKVQMKKIIGAINDA